MSGWQWAYEKEGFTEVNIIEWTGANNFDTYHDSNELFLRDEIGTWDEILRMRRPSLILVTSSFHA